MTLVTLLPRAALSTLVGKATRVRAPRAFHQAAIRTFVRRYRVDVTEAERAPTDYETFGDFFTRRLKDGSRPFIGPADALLSPVDGAVSQVGHSERGACIQAKGVEFPIAALLGDPERARVFESGPYVTLYLSPRDYHRIHAPLDGEVVASRYLPGELWPVNPTSVRRKPNLFCLNERLITHLRTAVGQVAVVAVGATCVSRIRVSYDDITTRSRGRAESRTYPPGLRLARGDELGVFEMGSTVILLFEEGRVRWDGALSSGASVRAGARLGTLAPHDAGP